MHGATKQINSLEVFQCGAGEEWRKSVGQVLWKNEEALHRVKDTRHIVNAIKRRNWIGHFLRRNCLLKRVIEGKVEARIEVTEQTGKET